MTACYKVAPIAIALFVLASNPAGAAAPEIEDLLGRWCQSDGMSYTFTRTRLDVLWPNGGKRTLPIVKIERYEDVAQIFWSLTKKPDGGSDSTEFEISNDKRLLIQRPNVGGDKGPRREFHRC